MEKDKRKFEEITTSPFEKELATKAKQKTVFTGFLLISPSLLLAILAVFSGTIATAGIAIATFIYQAVMIKNYLDNQETY